MKLKFTFQAFKASLPIWCDVFRSRWNLLMFLALVLINVAMWRSSDDAGICASFLGLWLVFHRFIIAHKDRQLLDSQKK